ncbi:aldehyde dehydrogenase [Nemania sp. FL0916]|nr:aldehyde dehydrogenase [Nemania sp. FL0916]
MTVNVPVKETTSAFAKGVSYKPANNDESPLDFSSYKNIIDGELSGTKETRHSTNPSTLEPNKESPISTKQDVDRAVKAAEAALPAWGKVPWDERKKAVLAYADALEANVSEFAATIVRELGLPLSQATGEVFWGAQWLRDFCKLTLPENLIEATWDRHVVERYTPIGVTVGIIPWNGPVILTCGKLAPAMLTGNALILKPSPFAPYCVLKMAELGLRFFPPGILQGLAGHDDLGPWLTTDPRVGKVSFTGSANTAEKVIKSCSDTMKRMTMELGGNDPAIVCEDVDPDVAGQKIATVALLRSGQLCMAVKRVYIHESVYDAVLAAIVKYVKAAKFGDGFEDGVVVGPICNKPQYDRVQELIEDIEKTKLDVLPKDGQSAEGKKGYFIRPIVINNPPDDSRVVVEEPFGPILPVMKWSDEDDVVRRANDTTYGLGASVWGKDLKRASRIASRLEAGNIWINTHAELQATTAFACHKKSGFGSELGVQGLAGWCNVQAMYTRPS